MKFTIRKLTVLLLAVAVILLTLLAFEILYVKSKISAIQTVVSERNTKQQQAEQSYQAQQVLRQYMADLEILESAYVDKENRIKLLSEIEILGDLGNITANIKRIDQTTNLDGAVIGTVIELQAVGAQSDLERFMVQIENLPYFLEIKELMLAQRSAADVGVEPEWSLDMRLFFTVQN